MKKLLVYFSYTGNTRMIANKIKEKVNCDILEIETVIPYSSDYDKVVNDERNGEASNHLPEIKKIDIDLDLYDTIILGSPVWWYRPCPAIRTFLTENNLDGKTIIPFATNAGWLGKTFDEIRKICLNSRIKDEISIKFITKREGDKLVTTEDELNNWINRINDIK